MSLGAVIGNKTRFGSFIFLGQNLLGKINNSVEKAVFGHTPEGGEVSEFILSNRNGLRIKVINFGAAITEAHVPDKDSQFADITLGFDTLAGYLENDPFLGVIAGRYANRIANGRFSLAGQDYKLATNNGPNHLHGGLKGFNKKLFTAEVVTDTEDETVRLSYTSADGEEGYPGEVALQLDYSLTQENELVMAYRATTSKATPINLTNHAYWNLEGESSGKIADHLLQIQATQFTPTDEHLIPTGELSSVEGTPLDFRSQQRLGTHLQTVGHAPNGYDHNFVLTKENKNALELAATVIHPDTGRRMDVLTTEPAVQLYTANFLDGTLTGKSGQPYNYQAGFCLECQHFPDSPNQPHFPSTILEPGQVYEQTTIHRFSVAG